MSIRLKRKYPSQSSQKSAPHYKDIIYERHTLISSVPASLETFHEAVKKTGVRIARIFVVLNDRIISEQ